MTWLMHTVRGHGPCSRDTKLATVAVDTAGVNQP